MSERSARSRVHVAGFLLGAGLGGFFDGIVFHQILQWHHLLSSVVPPTSIDTMQLNTLADGLFHAAVWIATLAGVFVLASSADVRVAGRFRALVGGLLLGWGVFNVVEGVVDHLLLGIHHVRPGPDQLLYDLAFLVWGGAMIVVGLAVVRAAPRTADARAAAPRG
jgi:uncharacterized membrane protein